MQSMMHPALKMRAPAMRMVRPACLRAQFRRGYATPAGMSSRHTFHVQVNRLTRPEEKDLVIIGGGVAGYVAAIKAGQAGLKVSPIECHVQGQH